MQYAGIAICLAIILGAVSHVGIHLYNDFMSMTFILGGALGFALLKNEMADLPHNFVDGAVYLGWLGLLVGPVAIAGNALGAWGNVDKNGAGARRIHAAAVLWLYGHADLHSCRQSETS